MKNNDLTFCVDKSNPRKVCLSSGIIVATLANLTSNPDPQKKLVEIETVFILSNWNHRHTCYSILLLMNTQKISGWFSNDYFSNYFIAHLTPTQSAS